MNIKALATDLDGTLLGADGEMSARNRDALREARQAGLEVILATARWYRLALPVAEALELGGPLIACQGAEVRLISQGSDLMDLRLPPAFADELFELCDSMRCLAWIPFGEEVLMKAEGTVPDLPGGVEQVASLREAARDVPRMALVQGTQICEALLAELKPRWEREVRFAASISSRGKTVFTLTSAQVNKGAALARACEALGIETGDVVAFGDAENDVEMFRVAGHSFAMGQADDVVKRAADSIAPANTEDGVARAVEALLRSGLPKMESQGV